MKRTSLQGRGTVRERHTIRAVWDARPAAPRIGKHTEGRPFTAGVSRPEAHGGGVPDPRQADTTGHQAAEADHDAARLFSWYALIETD